MPWISLCASTRAPDHVLAVLLLIYSWNWLNILQFVCLSGFYSWFVWFEPISVFEGLDKALA